MDETRVKLWNRLDNTKLIETNLDLDSLKINYENLINFKMSYFDYEAMKIKYCTSKEEAKEKKKTDSMKKQSRCRRQRIPKLIMAKINSVKRPKSR